MALNLMKFFKKITQLEKVRNYISAFVIFFLMNNLIVIGSEDKSILLKSKNDNQFEELYFQNSIPYKEYDNLESQLKVFFGFYSYRSENSFYPDLSIISNSESIREIYRSKLNDMTINDIIYNINR